MQGKRFSAAGYNAEVKRLSGVWRDMRDEDKEAYKVEALHQQSLLDELETKPLPLTVAVPRQEPEIFRNAAKKRSARRLLINKSAYQGHTLWDQPTVFGDGSSVSLTWMPWQYVPDSSPHPIDLIWPPQLLGTADESINGHLRMRGFESQPH